MLVFCNNSEASHDLMVLCNPKKPTTARDADDVAQWIAAAVETVWPSVDCEPHAVICGMYKNKYAILIHQHSCKVSSYMANSTFLRQGLLVDYESRAPMPLLVSSELKETLERSECSVDLDAIGISNVSQSFAEELWPILEKSVDEWRSESVWISTSPVQSVVLDARSAFGWRPPLVTASLTGADLSSTPGNF